MRTAIALGSNLGDRLANLRAGRHAVVHIGGVAAPLKCSRVYETEPVGTTGDCGAFLNAVIEADYDGEPHALLHALQSIEQQMGRPSRHPQSAPRTLDLDILYSGDRAVASDSIVIPHPRLHVRRFVLQPLADIRPELILPGQTEPVAALLAKLADRSAVEVFAEEW